MNRTRLAVSAGLMAFVAIAAACVPGSPRPTPETAAGSGPGSPRPEKPTTTSRPRSPSTATPSQHGMSRAQAGRALLAAAEEDDLAGARRAMAAKADLEVRDDDRRTPLVVATKRNHARVAKLLLEAGADPNATDALQDSAFLFAGAEGYDEILRETLKHGADVRSTNRFGGTALIPASEHAHVSTVRILIDAGVPLDHVNKLDWTAMLEAVVLGNGSDRHVDVVRQLIGAGADPTIPDGHGRSPRELAAARGFDRIVALIDDTDGIRARSRQLIKAARDGELSAVERLLKRDASVSAKDDNGATALVAAAYGNHLDVARRLLRAGADPNVKDETVQSAYLISTSEVGDDPRLLRLLLDRGADVGSHDSWNGTGLIRAADRGYAAIVTVLLSTDIAIDHVNRIGYTALHEAVVLGDGGPAHQRTVAALVRGGVDTSIKDSSGKTALESARARGYRAIEALLD